MSVNLFCIATFGTFKCSVRITARLFPQNEYSCNRCYNANDDSRKDIMPIQS